VKVNLLLDAKPDQSLFAPPFELLNCLGYFRVHWL
jgi:hypothetical protein